MSKLKAERILAALVATLGVVLITGLCQPAAGATGRPSDRFWKAIEIKEGRGSASGVDRRTGVQMSGREAKSGAVGVARTAAGSVQVRALGLGVSATVARRDGVQVLSELTEDESFADFELTLPPAVEPVADGAGGFDLVAVVGATSRLVVGRLEKPWAVDAEGRKLPTHYVLQGDRIRQHVEVHGAEFQVIADPTSHFRLGRLFESDWN